MLEGKSPAKKVEILTVALAQWREMYRMDPSPIISRKIRELEEELRGSEAARKEQEADDELTRYERAVFKDVKLLSGLELDRERTACTEVSKRVEEVRDECYDPMGRALDGLQPKLFQCERILITLANRADELRDEISDRISQIRRQQDATALRENAVGAAIPDRDDDEDEYDIRPAVAYADGQDPYAKAAEERARAETERQAGQAKRKRPKKDKEPKVEPLDPKTPLLPPEPGKKTREIELDE